MKKEEKEFIEHNDRECKKFKIYSELSIIFKTDIPYKFWHEKVYPHFTDLENGLSFKLVDLKAILIATNNEHSCILHSLNKQFNYEAIKKNKRN